MSRNSKSNNDSNYLNPSKAERSSSRRQSRERLASPTDYNSNNRSPNFDPGNRHNSNIQPPQYSNASHFNGNSDANMRSSNYSHHSSSERPPKLTHHYSGNSDPKMMSSKYSRRSSSGNPQKPTPHFSGNSNANTRSSSFSHHSNSERSQKSVPQFNGNHHQPIMMSSEYKQFSKSFPKNRDYVAEIAAKNKYWPKKNNSQRRSSNSTMTNSIRSTMDDDINSTMSPVSYHSSISVKSMLQHHYSSMENRNDKSLPMPHFEEPFPMTSREIDVLEEEVSSLKRAMTITSHDKAQIQAEKERYQHEVLTYQLKIQSLEQNNKKLLQQQQNHEQLHQWQEESETYEEDTYTSAETYEEMDIMDYRRRMNEMQEQNRELSLSLENTQIEMAEDSERCEEDLMKMDKLMNSVQGESTAEIKRSKQAFEEERIKPMTAKIKKLSDDLEQANNELKEEKEKTSLSKINERACEIEINDDSQISSQKEANMQNEFIAMKTYLEETLKQLNLVEEELKEEKKEKERVIQNLECEQSENSVRMEMVDEITVTLQNTEKRFEKERESLKGRIVELETEIKALNSMKNNDNRTVNFTQSAGFRQSSIRSKDATMRKQNSMDRRQKVIENSMQEMDDMIKTMHKKARQRNKTTHEKIKLFEDTTET